MAAYLGMSTATGRAVADAGHLRQSIADILTTPIGTRIERREYGSLVPELIDQPHNDATRAQLVAAIADALIKWEPRIRLAQIVIGYGAQPMQGQAVVRLIAELADTGQPLDLAVPLPTSRSFAPDGCVYTALDAVDWVGTGGGDYLGWGA